MLENVGAGLSGESPNLQSLADNLESLLLSPDKLRKMSTAGLTAVREKFNAAQMAVETLKVFEATIAQRRQPAIVS